MMTTFAVGALFLTPLLWLPIILYMAIRDGKRLLPFKTEPLYNRIFFVFALSATVSGILSWNWKVAVCSLIIAAFYVLTVYITGYCDSREKVRKLLELCFFFTVVSAVIGIFMQICGFSKAPNAVRMFFGVCDILNAPENADRLLATFYNANVAATFFSSVLIVGIYLLSHARGRQAALYAVGEALIVVALLMTDSRGALLGLFIGLVFYFACNHNRILAVFGATFFVVWLVLLMFAPGIIERGGEILLADVDSRWQIWKDGIQQFLAKPLFGWGYAGAYLYTGSEYTFIPVTHPHNLVLVALSYYGFIGFCCCCALELVKLKIVFELVKRGDSLAPMFLAISGVYWGQGIFDCTIVSPQGGILYFSASALLISIAAIRKRERTEALAQGAVEVRQKLQ